MDEYRESPLPHPGNAERLHAYWVHGKGAAKIGWGTPGDFDRCVAELMDDAHMTSSQAKGYCNLAHHAATGMWPAQHAEAMGKGHGRRDLPGGFMDEIRAQMSTQSINDLPDSAFAYIEPGGHKDASGKTTPRSKRHFPIHDEAHVRNALARAPQSPFGAKAMPKIRAAARKFGIQISSDSNRSLEGAIVSDWKATTERRFTPGVVEVRSAGDAMRIGGYAAVFNKLSRNLGGFVETVSNTAFNKARADGFPAAVARYNHDPNMILGTVAGQTLQLRVDGDAGLWYEVMPPQSRRDIVELVERGDVRHSSFAFKVVPGGDEWALNDQNYLTRTLREVALVDVAPVLDPAYPDATAGLRSLADHLQVDLEEVRSIAAADELRKFFIRTDGPVYVKPKPRTFGPAAAAALLARRADPWE